ncbi:hypothetical protein H8D79_00195 [PVC group bacterium]|nr:hypothetical protein [PVC group bacterium]
MAQPEDIAAQRRAQARRTLAALPWPTEAERIKEQVRRDRHLSSEDRFRRQLELLDLSCSTPEARAAARRWHDEQDAIEKQRYLETIRRYEQRCGQAKRPS